MSMVRLLSEFKRCESGSTSIEYAMVASLIAVVVVMGIVLVGESAAELYGQVENAYPDP